MTDAYSEAERQAIYRAIYERRDMRHFCGGTIDAQVLARLLSAAHAAPSVGLMQPWRFIRITDTGLREKLHNLVQTEREATANAMGERESEFLSLKVEGIRDCAELLVVTLMDKRAPHILGRRTMPHMDIASSAGAIQNLWLAARAEGLGMGWVSLFEPEALKKLLKLPSDSDPLAILCLGPVTEFYNKPMLEQENWAARSPLENFVMENQWQDK